MTKESCPSCPIACFLSASSKISLFLLLASAACAQSALVRVNQVGYPTTATKRAYLMASASEAGATFSVKNSSGTSLYSASIGANLGVWGTFPNVYALDFDSVTTPGTYTISVSGPITATSVAFKIDTGANLYSGALANTLNYYQSERDGPNFIANPLRTAAGHLNDQSATVYLTPTFDRKDNAGPLTSTGVVIDASGGWWDAGDYMKFVQTHSYTVGMMLTGVRDFPNQMGAGSSTSNFTPEAQFGLDWLQKMWSDSNQTLYYQVAVSSGGHNYVGDHDIWRLPQADDTYQNCVAPFQYICKRPVFINTAGGSGVSISPNLAGRLAASFALCFQVLKTSNPTYANQCLLSAEHVFALANTAPSGNLLTAAPFDFYPETEWQSDLEWGATELYFALAGGGLPPGLPQTNPMFYLTTAANWANTYITSSFDAQDTLNLYDVSGLAHYELYKAIAQAGNPSGLAVTQTALVNDVNKALQKALTTAASDPFGFGFPWNTYDTTSHGGGLVVMAWEYDTMTNTSTYAPYTSRWLANVLGANAWGTSLIVNDGSTFPLCMQHQVANLVPVPPNGPPFLSGAVVEGPNSFAAKGTLTNMVTCPPNGVDVFAQFNGNGAVYQDNVQSFSTVEPAIDLTASSFLAFSWTIAGGPGGAPAPDFSISASPSSQTVTQGNSTTYTATVSALNGFTGTVSFSVTGLPSGATGSFNPISVAGSGNSTLTVSSASSTPAGTYSLTVTGTSGSLTHSTTVTLVVQAAATPDFSISASPSSQTVTQGNSTTYTTTVSALNGFTGTVSFSLSGLPSGATGSFNPTSVAGSGNSTLTVTTASSTPVGAYTLTITGTSGSLTHNTTVTLTVQAAATPDFSISASPSAQTVTQGGSTTYTTTVSALNGFTGTVNFSVSGLPSGATGTFNPTSVAGSGNSTLTVSTTSSTPVGTYTLTITGTSGSLTHSTTVSFIVNTSSGSGNVTCSSGLPAGWTNNSIGGASVATASCSNSTFTVQSNGYGFNGKFDQGDLVSESVSGNHTIIAHVASVSSDGTQAQTGVMFRNSTAGGDQFVYVYINPSGGAGVHMTYRSSSGGGTTTAGTQSGINPPYWFKLVLSSGTFTGYSSPDGVTWTKVGSATFNMTNTNVLIGLAAANNSSATNTSTFDNVSVTSP